MNILLISAFYPPHESIGAQRPYYLSKALADSGYIVTVHTVSWNHTDADDEWILDNLRVIRTKPFIYNKIRSLFGKKRGLLSDIQGENGSALKKRILKYFTEKGVFTFQRYPDFFFFDWNPSFSKDHDLVITTAAPFGIHRHGLRVANDLKIPWVADWRDLWTSHSIFPGLKFFWQYEAYLEKKYMLSSAMNVFVSEGQKKIADALYPNIKSNFVYNGYDESSDFYSSLITQMKDSSVINVVYTGSVYIGKRDPSPLFKAINYLKINENVNVVVHFYGWYGDVKYLAEKYFVTDHVRIYGVVSKQEAIEKQKSADCLLLLENEDVAGVMTGKFFEYLTKNCPIIAIGISNKVELGNVLERTSRGIALGSDVNAIIDFFVNFQYQQKKYALNVNMVNEFSRELQLKKYLQIIRSLS